MSSFIWFPYENQVVKIIHIKIERWTNILTEFYEEQRLNNFEAQRTLSTN